VKKPNIYKDLVGAVGIEPTPAEIIVLPGKHDARRHIIIQVCGFRDIAGDTGWLLA
jgi:hypothetical protein